jgi:hypothetical protein
MRIFRRKPPQAGRSRPACKSFAEFAPRTARNNQIIFLTTCASEKFFSAASVSEGRAQPAASFLAAKSLDFAPTSFYSVMIFKITRSVSRMP